LYYCYRIKDQLIEYISIEFPRLIELNVGRTRITDKSIKFLKQMPNLKHLDLSQNPCISTYVLTALVEDAAFPKLKDLNMSGCSHKSFQNFTLAELDRLKQTRPLLNIRLPEIAVTAIKQQQELQAQRSSGNDTTSNAD
jgi:hypothetical protein